MKSVSSFISIDGRVWKMLLVYKNRFLRFIQMVRQPRFQDTPHLLMTFSALFDVKIQQRGLIFWVKSKSKGVENVNSMQDTSIRWHWCPSLCYRNKSDLRVLIIIYTFPVRYHIGCGLDMETIWFCYNENDNRCWKLQPVEQKFTFKLCFTNTDL